jgi:hypothetical protein
MIWVRVQMESARLEMAAGMERATQCHRVGLKMTRDEVIQLMGPPLKEYEVKPAGKTTEALFKEMIFRMPMTTQPAYVDFDLIAQRAIEINCGANYHINLPPSEVARMQEAQLGALPSDQAIP